MQASPMWGGVGCCKASPMWGEVGCCKHHLCGEREAVASIAYVGRGGLLQSIAYVVRGGLLQAPAPTIVCGIWNWIKGDCRWDGGRSTESLYPAMNENDCTSEEQVVTPNALCPPRKIHPYLKFLRSFLQEATEVKGEQPLPPEAPRRDSWLSANKTSLLRKHRRGCRGTASPDSPSQRRNSPPHHLCLAHTRTHALFLSRRDLVLFCF